MERTSPKSEGRRFLSPTEEQATSRQSMNSHKLKEMMKDSTLRLSTRPEAWQEDPKTRRRELNQRLRGRSLKLRGNLVQLSTKPKVWRRSRLLHQTQLWDNQLFLSKTTELIFSQKKTGPNPRSRRWKQKSKSKMQIIKRPRKMRICRRIKRYPVKLYKPQRSRLSDQLCSNLHNYY